MQLLSVACVSVAAKMEETHVPLLMDLQALDCESRFLFEPPTVRRMELLLMSALQWRVHGITPFDFLPFFSASSRAADLLPRASALIVSTLRGKFMLVRCIFVNNASSFVDLYGKIRPDFQLLLIFCAVEEFLAFKPSAIAAAALLCASDELVGEAEDSVSSFDMLIAKVKT